MTDETVMICVIVAAGLFLGVPTYFGIRASNRSAEMCKAKRIADAAFCQSLTVPRESNACLARLVLKENE